MSKKATQKDGLSAKIERFINECRGFLGLEIVTALHSKKSLMIQVLNSAGWYHLNFDYGEQLPKDDARPYLTAIRFELEGQRLSVDMIGTDGTWTKEYE